MDTRLTLHQPAHMPTMIRVRNVPDSLHRKLDARAVEAGMPLSEYVLRELARLVERPTRGDVLARIRSRAPVELSTPADVWIREARDGR